MSDSIEDEWRALPARFDAKAAEYLQRFRRNQARQAAGRWQGGYYLDPVKRPADPRLIDVDHVHAVLLGQARLGRTFAALLCAVQALEFDDPVTYVLREAKQWRHALACVEQICRGLGYELQYIRPAGCCLIDGRRLWFSAPGAERQLRSFCGQTYYDHAVRDLRAWEAMGGVALFPFDEEGGG